MLVLVGRRHGQDEGDQDALRRAARPVRVLLGKMTLRGLLLALAKELD